MHKPLALFPFSSTLVLDYLSRFDRVREFFQHDFHKWDEFANADKRIKNRRRHDLAKILRQQNQAFGCGKKTIENIERLAQPETRTVVTGQQTGLFGGPLYTIYKALTTIKLARKLQSDLKKAVVPVFYMVSEDHDFDEVRWAGVVDKKNRFQKLIYAKNFNPERTPISQIDINDTIFNSIESLNHYLIDTEFKAEILDQVKSCYQPGHSFSRAFACWISTLLHQYGVVLLDASDSRLKTLVLPVFERELKQQITFHSLSQSTKMLLQKGYHQQLDFVEKRPALFLLQQGRHSLEYKNGDLQELSQKKRFSIEELLQRPADLSAKAALRPIVQDFLLPTLSYVAGPGEIAYWAQLGKIYSSFDIPMPVVFPRAAFTLLETKTIRHLQRFDILPSEFIQHPDKISQTIRKDLVPPRLNKSLQNMRQHLNRDLQSLLESIEDIDPTLKSIADKAGNNMEKQINMIESKVQSAISGREKITDQQLLSLRQNLLPNDELQERELSSILFLCKYGTAWIDKVCNHIDLNAFNHKFVELVFND